MCGEQVMHTEQLVRMFSANGDRNVESLYFWTFACSKGVVGMV